MRRLGVLARADDGGLGNQTRELIRHLHPEAVLWILMGDNARGVDDMGRAAKVHDGWSIINHGPRIQDHILDALLERIDVLYTIEGPYHPELFQRCEHFGVELVIHANPELWKPREFQAHTVILPTGWRQREFDVPTMVVPFPVALDRFTVEKQAEVPTFLHLASPAMLDRQGTEMVLACLPHLVHDCKVLIRGCGVRPSDVYNRCRLEWLPSSSEYWEAYAPQAWALLQPRRYGGLSLPIQEVAAIGQPTITLNREPESTFYGDVTWRCPVTARDEYAMAGGMIEICETSPEALAATIDRFIHIGQYDWPQLSASRAWAEAHSWEALLPLYESVLR